jgi:uncharacterized protein (TIGR03067 family)
MLTGTLLILTLAAPLPPQPMEVPQGRWVVVSAERDPDLGKLPERIVFQFEDKKVRMFMDGEQKLGTFELEVSPKKKPKEMVFTTQLGGKKYILHALYRFEKDRLIICLANAMGDNPVNESEHPKEIAAGKNRELLTLERSK